MKFGKMKPQRRDRLIVVLLIVSFSAVAVGLMLMALNENLNFFYSPEQIVKGEAPLNQNIRAGGMVLDGSVSRGGEGQSLHVGFVISDLNGNDVSVTYEGILPDLFREGQGVIATGELDSDGVLYASEVLAKHDENYMPPEVAAVMEEAHKKSRQSNDSQSEDNTAP